MVCSDECLVAFFALFTAVQLDRFSLLFIQFIDKELFKNVQFGLLPFTMKHNNRSGFLHHIAGKFLCWKSPKVELKLLNLTRSSALPFDIGVFTICLLRSQNVSNVSGFQKKTLP